MVAQINSDYIKTRPLKLYSRLMSYALWEGRPLTTKGRWINPFVFAHLKFEKFFPRLGRVNKPNFVIGMGRSGTTILGIILSMHKDVGFLNEPKAMWHAIYSNEDINGCYTRSPARYRLDEKDATDDVINAAHKIFGAYLLSVGEKRVVDKYPELVFRIPFVRRIFPDSKFILLVRNGWDACSSITKWSQRLGATVGDEVHDWWGADNRKWNYLVEQLVLPDESLSGIHSVVKDLDSHTDMAAIEWIVTMREGLKVLNEYPDCVHLIRYEDLVEDPEVELKKLLAFMELPVDEVFYQYAKSVLRPVPAHKVSVLNEAIVPYFRQTMEQLGYEAMLDNQH